MRTVSKDIEQIGTALRAYQDAINKASAEDCAKLYTQDGIVMPQNSPSCAGTANVRKTYEDLFEIVKFDIKFDIQEVVPVSPEYAFARKYRENLCAEPWQLTKCRESFGGYYCDQRPWKGD